MRKMVNVWISERCDTGIFKRVTLRYFNVDPQKIYFVYEKNEVPTVDSLRVSLMMILNSTSQRHEDEDIIHPSCILLESD